MTDLSSSTTVYERALAEFHEAARKLAAVSAGFPGAQMDALIDAIEAAGPSDEGRAQPRLFEHRTFREDR